MFIQTIGKHTLYIAQNLKLFHCVHWKKYSKNKLLAGDLRSIDPLVGGVSRQNENMIPDTSF